MHQPNRIRWTAPLAIVGALALAVTLQAAPAETPSGGAWRVVAASGPVEVLPATALVVDGAWSTARRGDWISPRTIVRTGKRGRTTLTRDDAVIVVSPKTRIELPSEVPTRQSISSVVQTEGSVFYEIERRDQPHFEVVTPFLVAGVKGTSFLVSVTEDGATVGVEDGLVEVSDSRSDSGIALGAGEFAGVGRDGNGIERLDDDDRDDRRERRREERTLARLKDARDESGNDSDSMDHESRSDDGSDDDSHDAMDVADADSHDDMSDDLSDDLIADEMSEDSFDDDRLEDSRDDDDVYTDDQGASRNDRGQPDPQDDSGSTP